MPAGFPPPEYPFEQNQITEEGFQLGRKLFYDGKLSADGSISCASCHHQIAGFGTFDHDLSHGIHNQHTTRNAPTLANLAWQKAFRWDGSASSVEEVILGHIDARNEMGSSVFQVITKLRSDSLYPNMFKKAFGTRQITIQRITYALSQFVLSLVSGNAKYDEVKNGKAVFNLAEQTGYDLFKSKCASCHTEPLFSDLSYRNNGLGLNPAINDIGRMRVTGNKQDSLKFRVTQLRNVLMTFPYGHDGKIASISQMLTHYESGIVDGSTLDPLLKNKIPLTAQEKFYLQQFLSTLTDSSFMNNPRFEEK
ncbi:MAG TPA: cytochrome-c peroxidase [Flavitalea sp.]|nr:cytochrome-c peroxidase [Flavitalea sp.]